MKYEIDNLQTMVGDAKERERQFVEREKQAFARENESRVRERQQRLLINYLRGKMSSKSMVKASAKTETALQRAEKQSATARAS